MSTLCPFSNGSVRFWPHESLLVAALLAVGLVAGGCDLFSSSESAGTVQLAMETATSETTTDGGKRTATGELTVSGSNGTLVVSDLYLIVDEFELERAEEESDDEDDFEEVERGPYVTDLDLDGTPVEVSSGTVPFGRYEELSFEVEDLDEDDDSQTLRPVLEEAGFSDWPEEASMVAVGTFTPTDGDSRSFTTYFEAEIEIEMELDPPLEFQDGDPNPQVTVQLDPARWFSRSDGRVRDLSAFDYADQGELIEFELEIEEGFADTEIEREFGD